MTNPDQELVVQDATVPARHAETILLEAAHFNEALAQLAERTSDLIALCDPQGMLTYLNPAGRRLVGLGDTQAPSLRLADYVAPGQRHLVDKVVMPAARVHGEWTGEMQLFNVVTHVPIDVLRSTYATKDPTGATIGFVSVMRDISQRKAEEDRLRRQVDASLALIADNPFGMFLVDADLRVRFVSRGAEGKPGDADLLLGRDLAEVARRIRPPFLDERALQLFRDTLASGVPYQSRGAAERRTGTDERPVCDWRIERVVLPDERFGIVCHFYDPGEEDLIDALSHRVADLDARNGDLERRIRERTVALHFANQQLLAQARSLDRTQAMQQHGRKLEAIGELTASVAHDFNNLLAAIIGGFRIIEGQSSDPRIQQVITMGNAAADRGAAMVRQLLQFARSEEIIPRSVDVPAALSEIAGLLGQDARGDVTVVVTCDPDTWPVYVDPAQLQSALLNLANNARDAMPEGGRLEIRASNCPARVPRHPREMSGRDAVAFEVIDDGAGIDGPTLQRITRPFFTTKPRGRGTGLGLAIVKRFASDAAGALRISSRLGHGSTFTIYLPRAGEGPGGEATRPPPGSKAPPIPTISVLFVDADDDIREIYAPGLIELGYDVLTTSNATEAAALLQSKAIDLLVVAADGFDTAEAILPGRVDDAVSAPAVLLVVADDAAPADGANALRRPFTIDSLHEAISGTLAIRNEADAAEAAHARLAAKLQSDCAKTLFDHWHALAGGGTLPRFDAFDLSACSEPHRIVVAQVDLGKVPIEFRFSVVGDTLREALNRTIASVELPSTEDDSIAARETAYRRCALSGQPVYESARFDLGDGVTETFERLLLPLTTTGEAVDRIVGAVIFDQIRGPSPGGDTHEPTEL